MLRTGVVVARDDLRLGVMGRDLRLGVMGSVRVVTGFVDFELRCVRNVGRGLLNLVDLLGERLWS